MKKLHILARASLLISVFSLHLFADDRYLVRVNPSVIDSVAKQHNLRVERQIRREGVYLVRLPQGASQESVLREMQANAAVQSVAANANVTLPEVSGYSYQGKRRVPFVPGGHASIPMPGNAFSAYVNQKPNSIIRLQQAQKRAGYGNSGLTVAVIDTWVDGTHAVLQGFVLPMQNFVNGANGSACTTQETTPFVDSVCTDQETTPFVDQETTPFVDGLGSIVVVQQETTPFVDQETTPFVDQETTPFVDGRAWGHGTMVAGIIHLVAPNVKILPMRAFKSDGSGLMSDVLSAIQTAIDQQVDVINMSFSTAELSPAELTELNSAIADAEAQGIICVASVANQHSAQSVYPAAINPVIAVAATDNNSERASFSNYGPEVDIAAPGVDIWTTYPHRETINTRYAAATGTSFSTAYVTGAVALMKSANSQLTAAQALADLKAGADKVKSPELKAGELDVFKSVK